MEYSSSLILFTATLCLATVSLLRYLWKYRNFPPGPHGLPLVGYLPFIGQHAHVTFKNLAKKYGSVFSVSVGTNTIVVVNDFKTVTEVLVKKGKLFHGRPDPFLLKVIHKRKDIATNHGELWKQQKHLTTKILRNFGFGRLSLYNIIMDEVNKLAEYLRTKDNKPVFMESVFFIPTLNVFWSITVGKSFENGDESMKQFNGAVRAMSSIGNVGLLNIWPDFRFVAPGLTGFTTVANAWEYIRKYMMHEVSKHKANFNDAKMNDFIDMYLREIQLHNPDGKDETPYHEDNLISTIFNLFSAGGETTQTILDWAILYMVHQPAVQKKVQDELDHVMANDNSFLSPASRILIPYTEATLCEIQRITTIVPLNLPHCPTTDATLDRFHIPKGTTVITNLWSVHHDENYWGDPENFRPERFLDDHGSLKKHEHYLPFSAGPRVCLGEAFAKLELTTFFSHLLHRFSFKPIPGEPLPTLEPIVGLTSRPHPYSCMIKCRQQPNTRPYC